MLLIYFDKQALSETERQACYVESTQLAHEIKSSGQYLAANPLHPTAMATAVRVRDGQRFVTGGPFAETREQLGGYFLIDAKRFSLSALAIFSPMYWRMRVPFLISWAVNRPFPAIRDLPTHSSLFTLDLPPGNTGGATGWYRGGRQVQL